MDFNDTQKVNNLTELQSIAKETITLAKRGQAAIAKWQAFGITPEELITLDILGQSTFQGITADVIGNWIGSLDNFAGTWYSANGVNARLMTE